MTRQDMAALQIVIFYAADISKAKIVFEADARDYR